MTYMTATLEPDPAVLTDVTAAYRKRRQMAQRLADQDRYIGTVVRQAREVGHTWSSIAAASGTSDVAVLKAARRPEDTS